MTDLLGCPFCGGEAERVELTDADNFGGSVICCKKCGASSPVHFDRKENLESSWNDRTRQIGEAGDTDELVEPGDRSGPRLERIVGLLRANDDKLSHDAASLCEELAAADRVHASANAGYRKRMESSLAAEKQRADALVEELKNCRLGAQGLKTQIERFAGAASASEQRVVELTADRDGRDAAEQEARLQNDRDWRAKLDHVKASIAAAETQMRAKDEALKPFAEFWQANRGELSRHNSYEDVVAAKLPWGAFIEADAALAPVTTPPAETGEPAGSKRIPNLDTPISEETKAALAEVDKAMRPRHD